MSLGNPRLEELDPRVIELPDGRLQIRRRWKVRQVDQTWAANLRTRLFQPWGTPDGDFGGADAITPRPETVYPNTVLIDQGFGDEQRPTGRTGEPVGESILFKVYEELATDTLTPVPGARTFRDANNLLTREIPNLTGLDYDMSTLRGGISTGETTVNGTTLYLAKVDDKDSHYAKEIVLTYKEAGFVNRTEDLVGSQKAITITAWKTVPTHSDAGTGYVLARKQDADYLGFPTREYTFLKPSVLSRSTRFQNNNKIKRETVVAFQQTPTASFSPAVTIEDGEDNEDGIPTKRKVFVGGSGRISTVTETRNNGNLTLTTIRYIGTDDGDTPPGVLVSTQTTAEDGLVLYTQQYAEGAGEIRRDTNVILDGAVRYTTIQSLGTKVVAPGEFEDGKREESGYTIHTSRGVEILRTNLATETWQRNNGKLTFTKYARINSRPSGSGLKTAETISEREGFTLYEATYVGVTGSGEIGRDESLILDGAVKYITIRSLNTKISAPSEFESSRDERDLYTVHTSRGVVIANSDLGERTETVRGNIEITITRRINGPGSAGGNMVQQSVDERPGFSIYTNVFVQGTNGTLETIKREGPVPGSTQTTILSLQGEDPPGKLIEDSTIERDGYTLHRKTGIEGVNAGDTLFSYTMPYEVEVPGLVTPTIVDVPEGSVATVHVKGRTTKIINANVEVKVETGSPPDTEQPAFNMDGIACSVTFTKTRNVSAGWVTMSGANASSSSEIRDIQSSVQLQTYEGCALASTEATGTQDNNGDTTTTKVIGEGTLQGEVSGIWKEDGILKRKPRHLFTTVGGESYWEVMTIKV